MQSTLGQTSQPSTLELIFRSNVTPEITVDLSSVLTPNKTPPPEAVKGENKIALQVIKPEVIVEAFNVQKSIAPYGKPETGMYMYLLGGFGCAALLGASLTFGICRNPKKWIPITALIGASFAGFTFYQIR